MRTSSRIPVLAAVAAAATLTAAAACGGAPTATRSQSAAPDAVAARTAPRRAPAVGRTTVTAAHLAARPPAPSLASVQARIAKDDAQLLDFAAKCQADDGPYSAAERARLRQRAADEERNAPPAAADGAGAANGGDAADGGGATGGGADDAVFGTGASPKPSPTAQVDLLDRECAAATLAAASISEKDAGLSASPELRR